LHLKTKFKGVFICPIKTNPKLLKCALTYLKSLISPFEFSKNPDNENIYKNTWNLLVSLGSYSIPYTNKIMIEHRGYGFWTMPSLYFEYKLIKRTQEYFKKFPESIMEGTSNLWIMKPSFSSRGIGIKCFRDVKEIYTRGKKVQAKVVQKYIERPFLLSIVGPNGNKEKRKFDIRQWVLVTSMNPLIIYMFNSCYLRLCGSEFSLDDIKDKYKHLSNYSVQRKNTRVQNVHNDLIMSLPQFIEHLQTEYNIKYNWETQMLPRLEQIVKNTIYSVSDTIEHKPNCFELYGFDFVLDENLNPWLIEVNLSPACCERTDWLSEMLSIFKNNIL